MYRLTLERNYLPLDIDTRYHACLRYKDSKWSVKDIIFLSYQKIISLPIAKKF